MKKYDEFLDPNFCKDGSPQNAVIRFFFGLKTRNIDMMLDFCQITWKKKRPFAREKLEMFFGDIFLHGMKIKRMRRISDTCYEAFLQVGFKVRNKPKAIVSVVRAMVVCEKGVFMPDVNGRWGVNPISVLKGFGIYKRIFIDPEKIGG